MNSKSESTASFKKRSKLVKNSVKEVGEASHNKGKGKLMDKCPRSVFSGHLIKLSFQARGSVNFASWKGWKNRTITKTKGKEKQSSRVRRMK
ncbi:hypothetical protein V6N13_089425 [Hibiscus sabdariffa]